MVAGDIYDVAGDGTAGHTGLGGPATSAEINLPGGVAIDAAGDLYVADQDDSFISMVAAADCSANCPMGLSSTVTGDIYSVAGNGTFGPPGSGVAATSSDIGGGLGLGVDPGGDLLVADPLNNVVSLVAGENCSSSCPYGLSSTTAGFIYTVAGSGAPGADALLGQPAVGTAIDTPDAVTTAPDGTMFIGVCANDQIARVDTAGDITLLAGDGQYDEALGDGGPADDASMACGFDDPPNFLVDGDYGLAYDAPRGNFYLSDPSDNRVRVVGVPTGVGSTVFAPVDSVGGDTTTWDVNFETSTRGGLSAGSGTVTITAPPGTTLPTTASDYTINSVPVTAIPTKTAADNVTLTVPAAIANSTAVSVSVSSVHNPPAGGFLSTQSSVVTTSDPEPGTPAHGLVFTVAGAVNPPQIAMAFGAPSMEVGQSTSLTFTLDNPSSNAVALSGVGFTDALPAGLQVASPSVLSSTCSGTTTAASGSTSVSLSGATLATDASCTMSLQVTGISGGEKNNSVTVTSTNGGTGNNALASVNVVAPPVIAKAFGTPSFSAGGTTSLTFTVTNPAANTVALTGVAFTDSLPSGLQVATPNGESGTCGGGTITAGAGSSSVSLAGATLGTGGTASCTFSVNVTAIGVGEQDNSVTVTSTNGGAGNTATASVDVTAVAPPVITKSFGVPSIVLGSSTSLSFTVTNPPANTVALSGVGFTDVLPAGLNVSTPDGETGTCGGGTISATAGSSSVSLTGATLGTGGSSSCTFSVNVTGVALGEQDNSVTVDSTNGGTGNTATASVDVTINPPTIADAFGASSIEVGGSTSLTFNLANPATNAGILDRCCLHRRAAGRSGGSDARWRNGHLRRRDDHRSGGIVLGLHSPALPWAPVGRPPAVSRSTWQGRPVERRTTPLR